MLRRNRIVPSLAALAALAATSVVAASEAPPDKTPPARDVRAVRGVVVGMDEEPVAGARIAPYWSFRHGQPMPSGDMVTDEAGRFEGEVSSRYGLLLAYAPDFEHAGTAPIMLDEPERDITIMLLPAAQVTGRVTCTEMGRAPGWFNSYWSLDGMAVVSSTSKDGGFEVPLPRRDFTYQVYDEWFTTHRGELKLLAGRLERETIDLGEIDLPAHFLAKHIGKELPEWNVTDARGVNVKAPQLGDFRGKWVLLEFWGFW